MSAGQQGPRADRHHHRLSSETSTKTQANVSKARNPRLFRLTRQRLCGTNCPTHCRHARHLSKPLPLLVPCAETREVPKRRTWQIRVGFELLTLIGIPGAGDKEGGARRGIAAAVQYGRCRRNGRHASTPQPMVRSRVPRLPSRCCWQHSFCFILNASKLGASGKQ
jgi:hypothetical protein